MSKNKRFLCVGVLLIAICMVLVSCNSTDKIDDFRKKLENADNCEMVVTMNVPLFGEITMISKIDGNKTWESAFMGNPETYTETNGGMTTTYTKTDSGWEKTVEASVEEENSSFALLDSNNFEYSNKEKAYVLKDGTSVEFDGIVFTSAKLTIGKDSGKIEATAINEGMTMKVTIEFKNIGTTKVDLPM